MNRVLESGRESMEESSPVSRVPQVFMLLKFQVSSLSSFPCRTICVRTRVKDDNFLSEVLIRIFIMDSKHLTKETRL